MKPQGIILRRGTVVPPVAGTLRVPSHETPNAQSFPWFLTRRLHCAGKLALFRASANTDRGPGCYLLKTLKSETARGHFERALLRREAAVASTVKHPNLICILAADHDAPRPYSLLPYREGVSLRNLLQQLAPRGTYSPPALLSIPRVLGIARQTAEALAAMHHAGWLHGQVRPEHVVLSPQGHATLIDLTMARRLESLECEFKESHLLAAVYSPPEMSMTRQPISLMADTYSLGIVLHEALTGQPPFTESSPRKLLARHQTEAPPDIRQLRPGIALEVVKLLRLMLAKDPSRRPTDSQLLRWLAELEIASLT